MTKGQELARAVEVVDLQAKQMGKQSYELKTEVPLSVHEVVQRSSKSSKQANKKSGKGHCFQCGHEGHDGRDKCCSH